MMKLFINGDWRKEFFDDSKEELYELATNIIFPLESRICQIVEGKCALYRTVNRAGVHYSEIFDENAKRIWSINTALEDFMVKDAGGINTKALPYASKPQRTRRVPLMVTEELYSKIKFRAQAEHRTVNDLLNAVIEHVIGEKDKEDK